MVVSGLMTFLGSQLLNLEKNPVVSNQNCENHFSVLV